jgi:hypothetical protein
MPTKEPKMKRDEKTKAYIEEVKNKIATLSKKSNYAWNTNCVFNYNGEKINIHTCDLTKLVSIATYLVMTKKCHDEACQELGVKTTFTYFGETYSNWMSDFRNRVEVLKIQEEKSKLEKMLNKLNGIISEELKAEMVLENIENELKSDVFQ